jgi:hypothetical protein
MSGMFSSIRYVRPLGIRTFFLLALIGLVALSPLTISSHAAAPANLSITSSTNVFVASTNSTLLLEIMNVGNYLKELDVALTVPSPLVLFGDNHWIRSSFAHGDAIRANLTVFAPSSAAGTTVQGSIVAQYKAAGETTVSSETHAISFLVRGWIDLTVYEVTVDPDPALPGSEITISGNILNRGVVPAMYANVTLAADPPLVEDSVKPTYVGEVDANAPAPFSVTVSVDSGANAGSYQASVLVFYRDDLQADHIITIPVSFNVVSELPKTTAGSPTITSQLSNPLLLLGVAAVIALLAVAVYLRRRKAIAT